MKRSPCEVKNRRKSKIFGLVFVVSIGLVLEEEGFLKLILEMTLYSSEKIASQSEIRIKWLSGRLGREERIIIKCA